MFTEISKLGDVGTDPREGTIEIEAKIGTILKDNERVKLPVVTAAVVAPSLNYQFESQMTMVSLPKEWVHVRVLERRTDAMQEQHKSMNEFLNTCVQDSHRSHRTKMEYKHLRETDSFYALSKLGKQSLPQSLQRHQKNREPRLRVTRERKKNGELGPVIARIVSTTSPSDLALYWRCC